MTKIEKIEKAQRNAVIRRNHQALRENKIIVTICKANETKTFEDLLNNCKTQASIIQTCFENNKTQGEVVEILLNKAYFDNEKDAVARIIRHVKHDKASRIVSRSLHIAR
jgi:hypothetical protein